MREILKYFNLSEVARATGMSYSTLKNFNSGRKAHLTPEEERELLNFFKSLKLGGM